VVLQVSTAVGPAAAPDPAPDLSAEKADEPVITYPQTPK
jgi:hypothetical protein